MNKILTPLLTLIICLTAGCGSDEPGVTLPTNLTLTAEIADDGSGAVTFTATAENAAFYQMNFGDAPGEAKNTSGIFDHTYLESGDYTVTVTAHADEDHFIEVTEVFEVDVFFEIPTTGYTTPTSYAGMDSVWFDEFGGTELNEDYWTFEIGDGCPNVCGWGNNELEYYKKENTTVSDGYMVIEAKSEVVGNKNYSSSRIITRDKISVNYGRVDVRAVLPKGQGIWPAIWMLGSNIGSVGWPACGEIDIMEMIGGSSREKTVHGTAHWSNNGNYASYGQSHSLTSGIFADEFHVFSIVWEPTKIIWYVDDVKFNEIDTTPAGLSEFQEEFFFIMNVAVGGNWPGSPDGTTRLPQRMAVDYIRVFQNQ